MKNTHKQHSRAAVTFTSWCAFLLFTIGLLTGVRSASAQVKERITELASAKSKEDRLRAVAALAKLGPDAIPALEEHLKRNHKSSEATRRQILSSVGAAVPDKTGRFKNPKRQTEASKKKADEFDWIERLAKMPSKAGLSDVLVDVAIIRALAAMKSPDAGRVILDLAFSEKGLIYRDECGRYLRKMSPYSLPALIHGSQSRKNSSMKRYTNYQLERLDRQEAHKAILSATTEDLKIAVLTAYAKSQYREAVFAVLDEVDNVAPRIRKAARDAWMEYATGREPRKPPERKLVLPNNKLSAGKKPLWLDHRVLAETAIRARLKKLTGKRTNRNSSLEALTKELFAFYDTKRNQTLLLDFDAALALAKAGKPEQATPIFDRILAQNPEFEKRGDMVAAYMAQAESLESAGKWKDASIAYGKASAIAPDNQQANAALKKHHLARSKMSGTSGQEAKAARELAEEIEVVDTASPAAAPAGESKILLFAGLGAMAAALLLLLVGLSRRRQGA